LAESSILVAPRRRSACGHGRPGGTSDDIVLVPCFVRPGRVNDTAAPMGRGARAPSV